MDIPLDLVSSQELAALDACMAAAVASGRGGPAPQQKQPQAPLACVTNASAAPPRRGGFEPPQKVQRVEGQPAAAPEAAPRNDSREPGATPRRKLPQAVVMAAAGQQCAPTRPGSPSPVPPWAHLLTNASSRAPRAPAAARGPSRSVPVTRTLPRAPHEGSPRPPRAAARASASPFRTTPAPSPAPSPHPSHRRDARPGPPPCALKPLELEGASLTSLAHPFPLIPLSFSIPYNRTQFIHEPRTHARTPFSLRPRGGGRHRGGDRHRRRQHPPRRAHGAACNRTQSISSLD